MLEQVRPTGMVGQLVQLLRGLKESGVNVKLALIVRRGADTGPLAQRLSASGIDYAIVRERGWLDTDPVRKLGTLLREWKPDIVQTHGYKSAAFALLLTRRFDIPWLAFYHGRTTTNLKIRAYHLFERFAMRRATAIAAVAPGVEEHFGVRDRARISVIPNGILPLPPATRSRAAVRAAIRLPAGACLVGFVGRLSSEKGPDIFLRMLEHLVTTDRRFHGLIVGDGPDRRSLERLAETHGLTRHVHFAGRVDDVASMYAGMDVLVISSRSEVFPNVLLEAVEALLPVVATPVGGIALVSEDLPCVTVTDQVDATELANGVVAIENLSPRLLEASRDTLRERYSQERRLTDLLNLYRDIVERRA